MFNTCMTNLSIRDLLCIRKEHWIIFMHMLQAHRRHVVKIIRAVGRKGITRRSQRSYMDRYADYNKPF